MPKGVYKRTAKHHKAMSAVLLGNTRAKGAARSPEMRARISNTLKGRKLTPQRRARIGDALRGRKHGPMPEEIKLSISNTKSGVRANIDYERVATSVAKAYERNPGFNRSSGISSLEFALQLLLETAEFDYRTQVRFGRYVVDAWVPEYGLVFEADGSYWHSLNPGRDQKRDKYLLNCGVTAVIRLNEHDLNGWLE